MKKQFTRYCSLHNLLLQLAIDSQQEYIIHSIRKRMLLLTDVFQAIIRLKVKYPTISLLHPKDWLLKTTNCINGILMVASIWECFLWLFTLSD